MASDGMENLFLTNLTLIDGVIRVLARRHALSPERAAEFDAWAKLRLMENDFAVLRMFRGRSSMSTYLTVVLHVLFREFRGQTSWHRATAPLGGMSGLGVRVRCVGVTVGTATFEQPEGLHGAAPASLMPSPISGPASASPSDEIGRELGVSNMILTPKCLRRWAQPF